MRPKVIALLFLEGEGARVLRVDDLTHETIADVPDLAVHAARPGEENVQMRIRVQKLGRFEAAIGHLEKHCRRSPIKIKIDGKPLYEEQPLAGRDFERSFS